uniref:Uncharacterized protein n=1 Tax=Magallana gigas TaxID=29159 RepID=K1RL25_MAGGI
MMNITQLVLVNTNRMRKLMQYTVLAPTSSGPAEINGPDEEVPACDVVKHALDNFSSFTWIGASDHVKEEVFQWTNKENVVFTRRSEIPKDSERSSCKRN